MPPRRRPVAQTGAGYNGSGMVWLRAAARRQTLADNIVQRKVTKREGTPLLKSAAPTSAWV